MGWKDRMRRLDDHFGAKVEALAEWVEDYNRLNRAVGHIPGFTGQVIISVFCLIFFYVNDRTSGVVCLLAAYLVSVMRDIERSRRIRELHKDTTHDEG